MLLRDRYASHAAKHLSSLSKVVRQSYIQTWRAVRRFAAVLYELTLANWSVPHRGLADCQEANAFFDGFPDCFMQRAEPAEPNPNRSQLLKNFGTLMAACLGELAERV